MAKRSTLGGGTLLAAALLFIGLTILFNHALRGWRLDLTQNHLYTTAPGTDRILQGIKEPINLYFFYSEKLADQLPDFKTYGTRVRELLEELQARSNGNVRLHVVDPQPFSEEEDRATELGVRSIPVGPTGQQQFFMGLAGTNSTDGKQAIDFLNPRKSQFLEYDVVKLIYTLANPKKPVVAWLSTIPMSESLDQHSGQMRPAWAIYSQAQQLFDVREVSNTATQIDPDVNALVIIHPKGLSPATQWAIDQYALRGGHILLFVDPLAEADPAGADQQNPMAAMGADRSSHFGALLTAWGVNFDPKLVVADRGHALSVSTHQGEPPQPHLGYLGLDDSSFNSDEVVLAGLSSINIATTGFLTPVKGATTKFESILRSSNEAEPLPTERFAMLFDPSTLREGFKPTGQRYTLAARVTGKVKTMFPGGPPSGVTLAPGQTALKESAKSLNLIVFADTDMLSDFMWVRQQNVFGQTLSQEIANNGELVLNSLDNVSGSTELMSVRGRAAYARPFTRVENLRRVADDKFHAKEQELEQQLRQTEEKLETLQTKRSDQTAAILSPEQEKELDHFQNEKLAIRKQLRQVRASLDEEIQGLGNWLKIINIVFVPCLFAVVVLVVAVGRRRRHATSGSATAGRLESASEGSKP